MCINRTPANVQKRLAAWSNHGPIPRDSGTGGTIEQWQSQPSARARSALAASSRRSQRELRASPAVSPALSRRKGGAGKRRRRAARARDRERGSGAARRAAAAHRVRARPLRSPLAFAHRSQPRRGSLRGRGAACACAAAGGRLAAAAPWRGRGDIDSVAIAPTGVAVAIETKTRTYDGRHLVRVPRAHTAGFARQSGSVTTSAREFRRRSKGAATQALAPTPPTVWEQQSARVLGTGLGHGEQAIGRASPAAALHQSERRSPDRQRRPSCPGPVVWRRRAR